MVPKLRECYVAVRRLTEQEIHQSYPFDSPCEVSDDVKSKTEELLSKTVDAVNATDPNHVTCRRDGSYRPMRKPNKLNSAAFEKFREKREKFINRKNKLSNSENSLDWSQDELRTFSDDAKPKKRAKRVRKYERDFEWTPGMPKIVKSTRTLRRHTRRPVIESETSNSDDDDLYNYIDDGDFYGEYANQNNVPSENNSATNCVENTALLNNQQSDPKSASGDIVSGIMENMTMLQNNKIKATFKNSQKSYNTSQVNDFQPKPHQRGRKRAFKSRQISEKDPSKVIPAILKEIILKVSIQLNPLEKRCKYENTCKYCKSLFPTNQITNVCCDICRDLGRLDKQSKSSSVKKSSSARKIKENKGKKVNKTMSRVLKQLPINEVKRLTYADKSEKIAGKGYSHCKSFISPKDIKNVNDTYQYLDGGQSSRDISKNPLLCDPVRTTPELKKKNVKLVNLNEKKSDKPANKISTVSDKNRVLFEKFNEGLLLMTFPDPDKELDEPSLIQTTKPSERANNKKKLGPENIEYDTYTFPPLPTVIVSNYCKDTNNLNLSHTYFQNEISHQHALKSSKLSLPAPKGKNILNSTKSNAVPSTVTVSTVAVSHQNSSLPNNSLVNIIPISQNSMQPFAINSMPVINTNTSLCNKTVTILPVLNSIPNFSSNNFVNSLGIRIDNVTSLKTYQKQNLSVSTSEHATINKCNTNLSSNTAVVSGSSQNKHISISVIKQAIKPNDTSAKRKLTNSDISSLDPSETSNQDISAKHGNFSDKNKEPSTLSDKSNRSINSASIDGSSSESVDDHTEQSSKSVEKSSGGKENVPPQNAISKAVDLLDALSILAVIDLEKNPQAGLNVRIQVAKNQLSKLNSEKNTTSEHNEKLTACNKNLHLLNIAKSYLSLYGSFTRVSEHLMRKSQMIQIKKEAHDEEMSQSSCMYSQSNNSFSSSQSESARSEIASPAINQIDNINSSSLNFQATSINHIEKLQSQIAAMNNAKLSHYGSIPGSGGTVHHYPVEQIAGLPSAAAPTPITPRNDCLVGEARETPSRGSGPRTPARPESAASQSEEQSLIQIKKERIEAASSPSSQCAYSQNTTLPQISSQVPVISEVPTLVPQQSISNTSVPHQVSNSNQVFSNQTNFSVQPSAITPNRTVAYNNNNQNYQDVFLNVTSKHPFQITPAAASNPDIGQGRQVIVGQQMFIQNGAGLCSKQAVPSVNNNPYVIRPPFTSAGTGGTLIVNNTQVSQNALLTNVSNQQFYTSNQVPQLYYPSTQITCMPTNSIPAMVTQEITATQIQPAEIESQEQMLCAVCNSQATLRCKQCARVAYCNTTCAKTYWHQKHKMECKPLGS